MNSIKMYQIKFSGTGEIPEPLDRNKNYIIAGEWEEISRTETDLKDGEIQTTFKLAPIRVMVQGEAGDKIRLKTKNSNSQRIRAALFRTWEERKIDQEFDDFYQTFTNKLVHPDQMTSVLTLLDL